MSENLKKYFYKRAKIGFLLFLTLYVLGSSFSLFSHSLLLTLQILVYGQLYSLVVLKPTSSTQSTDFELLNKKCEELQSQVDTLKTQIQENK